MIQLAPLSGGIFLGWSLGANNGANVFGTAVASRIVSFQRAALLCGAAIILGALLQGQAGIDTYSRLFPGDSMKLLLITSAVAAITMTGMTLLHLPVSTSQAIVGAICGIGLATESMQWHLLTRIVICWLVTPVGAIGIAWLIYVLLGAFFKHIPMSMLTRDKIIWSGLIIVGTYGAYALGANNVANATGIFSGRIAHLTDRHLTLVGGLAIALGVATFSKRIMHAVGSGIMPLDGFTSLVAVLAMSITVHIFAMIGVPVSSSQAIVGAIIGIGINKGIWAVKLKPLRNIAIGWLMTPIISLILAAAAYAVFV
ncbi:MAG: anion permease [Sedimentisphaerales bacterium]|nr:anion permease [Sedimentisphaerales bacterium]